MRDQTSTFDLDDAASEQKLMYVCFERWKREWKLTRGPTVSAEQKAVIHRSNSVPHIGAISELLDLDPELGRPLLSPEVSEDSTCNKLVKKRFSWGSDASMGGISSRPGSV